MSVQMKWVTCAKCFRRVPLGEEEYITRPHPIFNHVREPRCESCYWHFPPEDYQPEEAPPITHCENCGQETQDVFPVRIIDLLSAGELQVEVRWHCEPCYQGDCGEGRRKQVDFDTNEGQEILDLLAQISGDEGPFLKQELVAMLRPFGQAGKDALAKAIAEFKRKDRGQYYRGF